MAKLSPGELGGVAETSKGTAVEFTLIFFKQSTVSLSPEMTFEASIVQQNNNNNPPPMNIIRAIKTNVT